MLHITRFHLRAAWLALIIVIALAKSIRADKEPFTATGDASVTDRVIHHEFGTRTSFTLEGSGDPIGDFTGDGVCYVTAIGIIHNGQATLVDQAGDQVAIAFDGNVDDDGTFSGEFTIEGGTGAYKGAAGYGTFAGTSAGGIQFTLDGVINR